MDQPRLWFERVYGRLGLPFPLGALVGFVPFVALSLLAFLLAGLPGAFLTNFVPILPIYLVVNLYAQFATR